MNSSKPNRRLAVRQHTRPIVTALVEREEHLLMVQLAAGRFAGFWLLPSASVEEGSLAETAAKMLPERAGYLPVAQQLVSVQEEPKTGVLALRFVFAAQAGEGTAPRDPEIARACWMDRDAVTELLAERELVPTLGVMHLARAWAEQIVLPPLATLTEETACPCGSGFSYRGCCGWDMQ